MGRQSVDVSSLESTRPQGRARDPGKATYHWLQADSALGQRNTLETQLFARIRDLFGFECAITRYDLTNTLFFKEKRTDCPLLTLGLVLDGGGFPRHSQVLAGNVAKSKTLQAMLSTLDAPKETIARQASIDWRARQGVSLLGSQPRVSPVTLIGMRPPRLQTASRQAVHVQSAPREGAEETPGVDSASGAYLSLAQEQVVLTPLP